MSDIKLIYILLKILLFIVFCFSGSWLSKAKTNKSYWMIAIVPMLAFAIIEGLRFGRLIDYNVYYFRYIDLGEGIEQFYELLFSIICYVSYNCGIPYYMFIFFQCLFLAYATLLVFKNYGSAIKYALPIVLGLYIMNENFIRWYLAFSFILLSINSLVKNRNVGAWGWAICGVMIHFGFFFYFVILIAKGFLNRVSISPVISVGLLIISTFLVTVTDMHVLVQLSNLLLKLGVGSLSEGLNIRLSQMDSLIAGDVGKMGIMEASFSNNIRYVLVCFPGIYWGQKYMLKYNKGRLIYNLLVIGAILNPIFGMVEMLGRISSALLVFLSVVSGVVFVDKLKVKVFKRRFVVYAICLLSFLASCWPSISIAFAYDNDSDMMFIWDANGRNYLPY